MKTNIFEVFISHATADNAIAEALRALICKALTLDKTKIFVSSDGGSLRLGARDEPQITEAHKCAKAVVALMTPRSIFRPWVVYEAGGAHFQSAKPLFVVLSNGATVDCLPSPLKVWHAGSLSDRTCLQNLCKSLASTLRKRCALLTQQDLRRVMQRAELKTGDWETINVGLVAQRATDSPFGFPSILKDSDPECAKKEIYVFGPNLHYLTKERSHKEMIFDWLRSDRARKFTVVISDIRCKEAVSAWRKTAAPDFERHLRESRKTLKLWKSEAASQGLSISVFVTDFIPTTVVFVDPTANGAYMVLTPITYKVIPSERPQFIIGRGQNRTVFNYYWDAHSERIRDKCTELT